MRPWLIEDQNNVISIVSISKDKILVAFGDNSIAILALPSLNVVDLLPATWMGRFVGDIVTVHCDEPGERGFVYIGTSEGAVVLLECSLGEGLCRVCEYSITWKDAGLSTGMAVSSVQMCPKVTYL